MDEIDLPVEDFMPKAMRRQVTLLSGRFRVTKKAYVRGTWSAAEDEMLLAAVRQNSPREWGRIAELVPGRVAKQCRERWHNHLDPSVKKGAWTEEEDALIARHVLHHGHFWAAVAGKLPGRTDNDVKNRYYATLRPLERRASRKRPSPDPVTDDESKESRRQKLAPPAAPRPLGLVERPGGVYFKVVAEPLAGHGRAGTRVEIGRSSPLLSAALRGLTAALAGR